MGMNMYASDFGPDLTPEIFRFVQNILLTSRCSSFLYLGQPSCSPSPQYDCTLPLRNAFTCEVREKRIIHYSWSHGHDGGKIDL